MKPTPCANCRRDLELTDDGFCTSCDLEVRARQPPQALLDMRAVYNGQTPQPGPQTNLKALLDKSPKEFLSQLRSEEAQWRKAHAALTATGRGGAKTEEPEEDEGQERVEALIRRLLEEAQPKEVQT